MPRILLTNDDGIFARGIKALAAELVRVADVTVVAPDREQSATSHALTLHRPLRIRKLEEGWYSVDGTPTDCVNLGVLSLLEGTPPDLVVSGINAGLNLGDDVTYSGTVSAAFEGALLGLPAVAFSQEIEEGYSFERAASFARRLVSELLDGRLRTPRAAGSGAEGPGDELPPGHLLNVNFPARPFAGVRRTRLGRRRYQQSIVEKLDPRGRKYFWIAGTPEWQDVEGSDHGAIREGHVSMTPLHLDLTDYPVLERLAGLQDRLDALVEAEDERSAGEGAVGAGSGEAGAS